MTVTYTWSITDLTTSSTDQYADVVSGATWKLEGSDGINTTSLTGSTSLPIPEIGFVSYSDLTEEQVIGWVTASLGELIINTCKGAIESKLSSLSYQPKSLPWAKPKKLTNKATAVPSKD